MVQQFVEHFVNRRAAAGIEAWHVDARFSTDLDDVSRARAGKLRLLFRHCREAVRLQCEHDIGALLLVPAPPANRSALLRDWLLLGMMRRRFRKVAFYWQASGLGDWLENDADFLTRAISRRVMGRPDLSIVLGKSLRKDAEVLRSRRIAVVPNFMPDPAPVNVDELIAVRAHRLDRFARAVRCGSTRHEQSDPVRLRVLFLSTCTRTKGLFDLIEGVALANAALRESGSRARVELDVAGKFPVAAECEEFERRVQQPDLQAQGRPLVRHVGFAGAEEKRRLYSEVDVMGLPTYYPAEAFPTALVEAMAWGVPVMTTRWRAIPELLPPSYQLMVEPQNPDSIATCLRGLTAGSAGIELRSRFLEKYEDRVGLELLDTELREL